jgi:hypothetical protein
MVSWVLAVLGGAKKAKAKRVQVGGAARDGAGSSRSVDRCRPAEDVGVARLGCRMAAKSGGGRGGGLCLDLIDLGLGLIDLGLGLKEGSKCSIGENAMNVIRIIN